jgi:hypothetical protein
VLPVELTDGRGDKGADTSQIKRGEEEEMSQIIKPTQTRINREKYTFNVIKSLDHLKDLKTARIPNLGLELKSQIHLLRQSL